MSATPCTSRPAAAKTGAQAKVRSGNRKRRPKQKRKTALWIVVMICFFTEALLYAWCRVQCVNAGYAIDRQTRRHQTLIRDRNTLKIEWARLKSPERIETIARNQLGLNLPGPHQTVMLP